MTYKIKYVSELAGISVRTLHHYDNIGLLKPSKTSNSGYRLYSDDDLIRYRKFYFLRNWNFH